MVKTLVLDNVAMFNLAAVVAKKMQAYLINQLGPQGYKNVWALGTMSDGRKVTRVVRNGWNFIQVHGKENEECQINRYMGKMFEIIKLSPAELVIKREAKC